MGIKWLHLGDYKIGVNIVFEGGDIGVASGNLLKNNIVGVEFDELDKKYKIGDKNPKRGKFSSIVTLLFSQPESIDVVIKNLERAKELLIKNNSATNDSATNDSATNDSAKNNQVNPVDPVKK